MKLTSGIGIGSWLISFAILLHLLILLLSISSTEVEARGGAKPKPKKISVLFKRKESKREAAVKKGRGREFDANFVKKYKKRQAKKQQKQQNRGKRDVTDAPTQDYYDLIYVTPIYFGTPVQSFDCLLDTGSGHIYVQDTTCAACEDALLETYDSSESVTYQPHGQQFSIVYGTGGVSGFYGIDDCTIGDETGNITIENQMFGQAQSVDAITLLNPYGCVIGLAGPDAWEAGVTPPVQNAIAQGLFTSPGFMVHLNSAGDDAFGTPGALFTFGGVDDLFCSPTFSGWAPLSLNSWWSFQMSSVSTGTYTSSVGWNTASDTGALVIFGPTTECTKIAKKCGGKTAAGVKRIKGQLCVKCLKSYTVNFVVNGVTYAVTDETLTLQEMTLSGKWCQFGIQDNPALSAATGLGWILGTPFIREWCQYHDVAARQIGFSKSI